MAKSLFTIILIFICLALYSQDSLNETVEYILQAGDKISIEVMDHPEFSKELQILPDGSIEYPILGNLVIVELSSRQLSEVIKHNLEPYIPNPIISVYVTSIYDEKINIFGYVNKPGSFQIFKPVNLVEAFSIAGGIENVRKVKHVKLIRKNGKIIDIKVSKIWFSNESRSTENELKIYPGDTLIVPPPFEFNWSMLTAFIALISLSLSVYQVFAV